ncbi:MAG: hypothetical protein ABEI27_13550 [Halobellus sp.]|uniref:hypothetical protein n=1 Tax=Halobellus sp. TaxID=1979212 RepID=UPI0035D428C4
MKRTVRVETADGEFTITAVRREDWSDMREPSPACGGREFDHVSTTGGHYGQRSTVVVLRAHTCDAEQAFLTRCRGCGVVLDRHAAVDLLFRFDRCLGSGDNS